MKYLLDTNVLSDFVRGEPTLVPRLRREAPKTMAVSVVTEMEVEYGLARAPHLQPTVGTAMRALFEIVTMLPFEREDAHIAARLRADLAAKGTPVGAYDLLLAACALRRHLVFVTANTREFGRVSDLLVENWRG